VNHRRSCRPMAMGALLLVFALGASWTDVRAQNAPLDHGGQYTAAEVELGSRLYGSLCQQCHGPTGNLIAGIDLRRGQFRRSTSDEDLTKVIGTGVPGTGMPPFTLQPAESAGLVAFIRAGLDAGQTAVKVGTAAKGREIFEGKGACRDCHRVKGVGPRVAPDLTDVGLARTVASLYRSLTSPSSQMLPINRPVRIVTKDGKSINGRRLNEDTWSVQLIDDHERLLSVDKATIQTMTLSTTSPMPAYADKLTPDEISDVIAYLLTLKGL
jgi:putative heme-binding domain-containing protein